MSKFDEEALDAYNKAKAKALEDAQNILLKNDEYDALKKLKKLKGGVEADGN